MSLIKYAKRELELANAGGTLYGKDLSNAVMALIELFSSQGHSGVSAPTTISLFSTLAKFEPLSPLTGRDDEWNLVAESPEGKVYQNNRCSTVFKTGDNVYNIEGKVFRDEKGLCYTSRDSRVPVTFPYTPTTVIVDVDKNGRESVKEALG